jgi:hypothetical protein
LIVADSEIVAFYRGAGRDHMARSLTDLQGQSLRDLEQVHDYIQWLFPLPEPSSAFPGAPILTSQDVLIFKQSEVVTERLLQSLQTMLTFYGLELSGSLAEPKVAIGPDFAVRGKVWLSQGNHNFLRLTRILRSLAVLGCEGHSRALFRCLEGIHADYARIIGEETFAFWRNAVASG